MTSSPLNPKPETLIHALMIVVTCTSSTSDEHLLVISSQSALVLLALFLPMIWSQIEHLLPGFRV